MFHHCRGFIIIHFPISLYIYCPKQQGSCLHGSEYMQAQCALKYLKVLELFRKEASEHEQCLTMILRCIPHLATASAASCNNRSVSLHNLL